MDPRIGELSKTLAYNKLCTQTVIANESLSRFGSCEILTSQQLFFRFSKCPNLSGLQTSTRFVWALICVGINNERTNEPAGSFERQFSQMKIRTGHITCSAAKSRAFPELLYPPYTSRLAIHLTPATHDPEAAKCFDTVSAQPKGSAPLHCRAIQDCMDDRLPRRTAEQILRLASGAW